MDLSNYLWLTKLTATLVNFLQEASINEGMKKCIHFFKLQHKKTQSCALSGDLHNSWFEIRYGGFGGKLSYISDGFVPFNSRKKTELSNIVSVVCC